MNAEFTKIVSNLKENTSKITRFTRDKRLINRNFIFILFLITACGRQLPDSDFNSEAWQKDHLACNDSRKKLLPELEKIKPELLGLREARIQELLGKPEATSLSDQSERIYTYYLEPGAQCTQKSFLSSANKLLVRISAMGFVTEIGYEQPVAK